ncbi:pyocin knob domain-containing protein [Clostridium sp. ZBS4]|uniref:pyocin knob domain-containing protein n=1 Tax=Clostridium sp. ZBS4 TaxID=2949974 RepID=UPI002079C319|nr:pyocin knob domain-containing protein [Clostridium sp. ZBS4]
MNIQELQTERLDINNKYNVELVCKQLDDVILKIIVYDKNLPADLSNYNVRLKAFKVDQVPIIQNTNIIIKDNIVTIKADKQLTTTEGIVKAELQFINKTTLEKKSTFYLEIEVVASVLAVDGTVSIPTCTLLEELDNKLDEIENIGNVLEEAKVVIGDLEEKTITGTTLKTDLNTNIETGTQLKTDLTELIPQANKSKSDLDTSKINADLSNTTLTETTNNTEIKKQEVISECKVADEKIKQMNEFGDVTEVVKDVTLLKTEVNTARDNEIDLNTRLERDKNNILKTIGQVNVESDGDLASQLKDVGNDIKNLDDIKINKKVKYYTSEETTKGANPNNALEGCFVIAHELNPVQNGFCYYEQFFYGDISETANRIQYVTTYNGDLRRFIRRYFNGNWETKELATVDDTGWITLPLIPPLVGYGDSVIPKYRKINNIVEVRGAIKGLKTVSASTGLDFSTLPVGFRPKHTIGVVCQGSALARWYLNISSSGALNIDRYSVDGSTLKTEFNGSEWLPFQIMFSVD